MVNQGPNGPVRSKVSTSDVAIIEQCVADNPTFGVKKIRERYPTKRWARHSLLRAIKLIKENKPVARAEGSGRKRRPQAEVDIIRNLAQDKTSADASIENMVTNK